MFRRPTPAAHRLATAPTRLAVLGALAIALLVGLAGWIPDGPLEPIDRLVLDALVRRDANGAAPAKVVVVDVDDASLAGVGQWPWPRYRIAAMIERIRAERPAAIALDIVFPEPDRTSPLNLQQAFHHDFGLDLTFSGVPEGLLDNDGYLGDVMAHADVIGAAYFYFDRTNPPRVPPRPGVAFTGRIERLTLGTATGVLQSTPAIAAQTRASGFFNHRADADGVLRRLPLLLAHAGVLHPNLALAAAMRAAGTTSAAVEADTNGLWLRFGSRRVPIDARGEALLRFGAPADRFATISALDLLNGNVRGSELRDKIVFIGTTAVGMNDFHHTATDTRFPGLKIQAAMASSLLDGRLIAMPPWAPFATLVASLLAALLATALFAAGGSAALVCGSSLLVGAGTLGASALLFERAAQFVSPAAPLVTAALLALASLVARFATEQRRALAWRKELENARQVTIESMASVAETRDPETGAHIKRTQHYVRAIAEQLRRAGHHRQQLTDAYIELLFLSAPLHDIGKVGVPDHILLKPARLTDEEMEVMKRHAEYGRKIIWSTAQRIQGENFLIIAGDIAATHHERWDG